MSIREVIDNLRLLHKKEPNVTSIREAISNFGYLSNFQLKNSMKHLIKIHFKSVHVVTSYGKSIVY